MLSAAACSESSEIEHFQLVATSGAIQLYDAYVPAPAAPDVESLYFSVVNSGSSADTLLKVETSAGEGATLHEMIDDGGRMRMHPTGPVAIAPGDTLRMMPGGFHVMVTGLNSQPQTGDTIEVAVTFSRAGRIGFSVPVLSYTEVVRLLQATGAHEP